MPKSVESVFIFQEGCEGEADAAAPTYDAIVVEQWTIIDVSTEAVVLIQAKKMNIECMIPEKKTFIVWYSTAPLI